MKSLKSNILFLLLGILLPSAMLCSCSDDDYVEQKEPIMTLNFRVDAGNATRAGDESGTTGGYEEGSDWENFIDIAGGDYRICFFNNADRCITIFNPDEVKIENVGRYVDYTLEGAVPAILRMYSDFKIVALINWGTYPEIVPGLTTLDEVCCPTQRNGSRTGQFKYFSGAGYDINVEEQRYIPMFGLKEYTGVDFTPNTPEQRTKLSEKINLLRAVAKVEVVFQTDDEYELEAAPYISRYNEYGFCAPEGVTKESDYCHFSYALDYMPGTVHLPGGVNDSDEKTLNMTDTDADGTGKVWTAYIPEYRNVATTSKDCQQASAAASEINTSKIVVPFKGNGKTRECEIQFANYENGEAGTAMNIERNNLYRFIITKIGSEVEWTVSSLEWNGVNHETIVM